MSPGRSTSSNSAHQDLTVESYRQSDAKNRLDGADEPTFTFSWSEANCLEAYTLIHLAAGTEALPVSRSGSYAAFGAHPVASEGLAGLRRYGTRILTSLPSASAGALS